MELINSSYFGLLFLLNEKFSFHIHIPYCVIRQLNQINRKGISHLFLTFLGNKYTIRTIAIKITWHIEIGKEIPYKQEQPQNHNTKKAMEQQKETEIKEEKNQDKPSLGTSSQGFKRTQGATTKHP